MATIHSTKPGFSKKSLLLKTNTALPDCIGYMI